MPVLRTKVCKEQCAVCNRYDFRLYLGLVLIAFGGVLLFSVVLKYHKQPEPVWMWLVRACERDKDRCAEAEAHLARQCRAGDHAACTYPSLTRKP